MPYTGVGGVFRVRPDGSGFRSWPAGCAGRSAWRSTAHWNLFTNDNDHESRPDRYTPARLLHVTPRVDFGWPRGWMASKRPTAPTSRDRCSADPGRGVPVGMAYYDEPLFPAEYRHSLLLDRWDR